MIFGVDYEIAFPLGGEGFQVVQGDASLIGAGLPVQDAAGK